MFDKKIKYFFRRWHRRLLSDSATDILMDSLLKSILTGQCLVTFQFILIEGPGDTYVYCKFLCFSQPQYGIVFFRYPIPKNLVDNLHCISVLRFIFMKVS